MESSMTAAAPPVLTGPTDYFNWRRQLRIYVDGVNPMMWTFIIEGESTIAKTTDERLRLQMQTAARRAVHVILRSVSPDIATALDENKTAHKLWVFLEQRYSHGTVIQPYVLLVELVNLTQVGGVNEFISNIERVANERALMGYPIDAATKLGCLIRGVKAHLHPYTAAYEAQWEAFGLQYRKDPEALAVALGRLFDTAAMGLRNYETSAHLKDHGDMPRALAMVQRPPPSGPYTQRPLQMQAPPGNMQQLPGRPTCWHCGRTGHTIAECRSRMNGNPPKAANGGNKGQRGRKKGGGNANMVQILAALTGAAEADGNTLDAWIWDTGADMHICKTAALMTNLKASPGWIKQAHGPPIRYEHTGDVALRLETNRGDCEAKLTNVILLEGGNFNLFSPRAAIKSSGGEVRRDKDGRQCIMVSDGRQRTQVARAISHDGRTFLAVAAQQDLAATTQGQPTHEAATAVGAASDHRTAAWQLWHKRFNHASLDRVQRSLKEAGIDIGPLPSSFSCDTCSAAKFPRPSFGTGLNATTSRLDLVVSDVQGPMQVASLGGARYVLTITDVHTRYCWAIPIATKSTVFDAVGNWLKAIKGETGQYPKVFRSDGGGEFTSKAFIAMLADRGIERQTSSPYTPQQNGIAERLNRSLTDTVRAMLVGANLPAELWAEAYRHACWIKNRTHTKAIKGVPYVHWSGKKARMELVRRFGCVVWVMTTNRPHRKGKLEPQAVRCIWLGIADPAGAGHRCVDPDNGYKVYLSRDVRFADESTPAIAKQPAQPAKLICDDARVELELQQLFDCDENEDGACVDAGSNCGESTLSSVPSSPASATAMEERDDMPPLAPDNITVACTALNADSHSPHEPDSNDTDSQPQHTGDRADEPPILTMAATAISADLAAHTFAINTVVLAAVDLDTAPEDPTTLAQARKSPAWPKWEEAINVELASLESTGTWTIVDLPPGRKPITAKWVFKTKRDAQGAIIKHKARLVARGFTQIHGVDYHETYSPVVSMTSLRTVLCYGLKNHYRIRQIDFVAAYLNGELNNVDIYMSLPPGFEERYRSSERSVCNLKKSLYGLKQSGREWYAKLDASLISIGFKEIASNMAVYKLGTVVMAVYVDDIIIVGAEAEVSHVIDTIKAQFKITGGDDAEWCLGVRIRQHDNAIALSQSAYVDTILERFSMTDAAEVATPLDPSAANLSPTDPSHQPLTPAQVTTFQQIVGSVMYLMTSTRPDLAFPVSKLASNLASPTTVHLRQARHLLRYIKLTKTAELRYDGGASDTPVAYSDADHAGSWKDNPYSTSGYAVILFGGAIAWRSRRQRVISTSTAKAEVVALSDACHNIDWLAELLIGLGIIDRAGIKLLTNNQAAHKITSLDRPQRNKALTLRAAYLRDAFRQGQVDVRWITNKLQVANGLTKLLNARGSAKSRQDLGVIIGTG